MNNLIIEQHETSHIFKEPKLSINGEGNKLILEEKASFGKLGVPWITITGNNNKIHIDKFARINRGRFVISGNNQEIYFGEHTSVNGIYILCSENKSVRFGNDCLIANDIEIRTSDAHAVFDRNSMNRVNEAKDILIGDHVWLAKEVCLMPGAVIPSNTIVGMRSLVTKAFTEEYTVIAGVPAKVVATDRVWDRPLVS